MGTRRRKSRGRRGSKRRAAEERGGEDVTTNRTVAEQSRGWGRGRSRLRGYTRVAAGGAGVGRRQGWSRGRDGVALEQAGRGRGRLARGQSPAPRRCQIPGAPPPSSLFLSPSFPSPSPSLNKRDGDWVGGRCRRASLRSFPARAHGTALSRALFRPAASASAKSTPRRRLQPRGDAIRDEGAATATPRLESRSDA